MSRPTFRALRADDTERLLAFFDRPDQGFCFCRFWNFPDTNEAWLARPASANRAACQRDFAQLRGQLALRGEDVVGWLRWAPSAALPKLAAQGLEEAPPPDRASLLCFAVAADLRRQGIARGLLASALETLRAEGFAAVHAYPRTVPGEPWTGPAALFDACGFRVLRKGEPRAVWGRSLR